MNPGTQVTLNCPENTRLHGASATVLAVMPWGAFVQTGAAASGYFRAAWDEMVEEKREAVWPSSVVPVLHKAAGYEGEACAICGAMKLRRNGSCLLCDGCGSTNGCS